MSFPTDADFLVLKVGDGGAPEVFTRVCGMDTGNFAKALEVTKRPRFDCDAPGKPAVNRIIRGAKSETYTAGGVANADEFVRLNAIFGEFANVQIEARQVNGTDNGRLLGTLHGRTVVTGFNINVTNGGDSKMELNFDFDGATNYVAAP